MRTRLGGLFGQAFVTGFSGAAMPGPVLVATILLAGRLGFWAGPGVVAGHFLLEVSVVIALAAGLHRFVSRPDAPLVRAIGLVGGLVLLLMAADMLRSLPQLSLHGRSGTEGRGPLVAGLLLSAANPYFWIWWATIGLGLLTEALAQQGRSGAAAFYSGHILSDLAWYSLVAALIAGGGRLLSDGVYHVVIGACALLLIVFGARFVALAIRPRPTPAETPVAA